MGTGYTYIFLNIFLYWLFCTPTTCKMMAVFMCVFGRVFFQGTDVCCTREFMVMIFVVCLFAIDTKFAVSVHDSGCLSSDQRRAKTKQSEHHFSLVCCLEGIHIRFETHSYLIHSSS